ncbi:DivIVA domain-containing protein [Ornithinimicrobium faecis]|uniref:DivIVA domain-containing protein n=1 Tax=Ornithinimicrobium faecis TaxID=2934158 RepID=UPI002118943F|nr:DivIVA domain-containing protein [Ornithinimicrobium sp. HY1745]
MSLQVDDVLRRSFRSSRLRRGYDENEVDAFLEEVASDLRRREAERDELLARSQRPETTHEIETDRVIREREQLDLIRTERQELVSEMGALSSRLTAAREQIESAEQRTAAAEESQVQADARRDQATAEAETLERQVARAQAVHDDLRDAYDAMVADLRGLRTESESQALEMLGQDPTEPTGNPVDDVVVIRTLSRQLHADYVMTGQSEATRLIEEATTTRDALVSEGEAALDAARSRATKIHTLAETEAEHTKEGGRNAGEKLLSEARVEHERLLDDGATQRETLLAKAQKEHDQKLLAAETQSTRLIEDAQAERDAVIADLTRRRAGLEGKIAELENAQQEYRQRLRSLISEQLAAVDTDEWEPVGPASPQPARIA